MFGFTGGQIAVGAIGGTLTATLAIVVFGFATAFAAWCLLGIGIYAVSSFAKRCR